MKKIYITALVTLFCFAANVNAEEGTTNATVKMTYVDFSNPDKSFGEIAEGESAQSGFNKIDNKTVGFGNTGWGVNYITYLQVDASKIEGNIISATLTFEGSGSTDSKRTTGWGVGYNDSEWSADMTYNTADKNITTIGDVKWTSTKSAETFENFSFDITEAVNNAKDGVATILVYETAAAGGYIKNPKVEINWTTEITYKISFKETNNAEVTVTIDGKDVTTGTSLTDGTYTFKATASGFKDYDGEFTVEGAEKEVEFTMTPKDIWNYTLNAVDSEGEFLGELNKGTGFENENVTYYYPAYYLVDNTLLSKARNGSNPYWGATAILDSENVEFSVTYDGDVISDVVFYKEAEDMEGFIPRDTNNATVRCSNGQGGTVDGEESDILLTKLPAGKYQIFGQVWGTNGLTAGVKIKASTEGDEDQDLWTLESTGSLTSGTSEEFELAEETDLYVYTTGGNKDHMLDLIYITGKPEVGLAIDSVDADNADVKWFNLQGIQVAKPTTPGLYIHNGKKIIVK